MFCRNCGKEIVDNAVICQHCGVATNDNNFGAVRPVRKKTPIYKRWWFWAIVVILLLGSCSSTVTSGDSTEPTETQISEADYRSMCEEIAFDDLARNPDAYKGDYFTFTGEVIQVMEGSRNVQLRLNVTPVTYYDGSIVYYEDTIYCSIRLEEGADRILEGDVITIYGECAGMYSYQSVFGGKISLPRIDIEYYELVSQ